ncbi:hypothetical protein CSC94_17885 [Zhengella mangrovi]|uniref:Uncharacterized protein n=2 Tax=Zhengella mangrovi TaxID=1982044 RepID=A0A2G1QJS1_9HYPH|nr:hypothetical protein CSC94_17885 [Zhengella mangrovi]
MEYESIMSAIDVAIQAEDMAALKKLDLQAIEAFENILAYEPHGHEEAGEMFDYLLEMLCVFERGGRLWWAIRARLNRLYEER